LLESWQEGLFWYAWDRTATIELTPDCASQGLRGLRLNFDSTQYAWPVLVLSLATPWNLADSDLLNIDVYVPTLPHEPRGGAGSPLPAGPGRAGDEGKSIHARGGQRTARPTFARVSPTAHSPLSITAALQGAAKHEAPPIELKPGWNTIATPLNAPWLPAAERGNVRELEWGLSTEDNGSAGYVVFDNLRIRRHKRDQGSAMELLESWERPLLWRVFDETVGAETIRSTIPDKKTSLVLHLDFSKCSRPVLFAKLNPPWDLSKAKGLSLQMRLPINLPDDLSIALAFRAKEVQFQTPPLLLHAGLNEARFDLTGSWLPQRTRAAAEQVEFTLVSTNTARPIDITFEKLSAGDNP